MHVNSKSQLLIPLFVLRDPGNNVRVLWLLPQPRRRLKCIQLDQRLIGNLLGHINVGSFFLQGMKGRDEGDEGDEGDGALLQTQPQAS